MFKQTSESQSLRRRIASHSTKPLATGVLLSLPPDADVEEEAYLTLKEQLIALITLRQGIDQERKLLRRQIGEADRRTRDTIQRRIEELGALEHGTNGQIVHLKKIAYEAGEKVYCTVFWIVARMMLSPSAFDAIDIETKELMGRSVHTLPETIPLMGDEP